MKIKQTHLNFFVDALGLVAFCILVSTGILMHWLLPHGSGHSLRIWGLGRHDWGEIHFWTAITFLAVVGLHLFLHWKWIIAVVRGRDNPHSGRRLAYGSAALALLLIIVIAPLVSPVKQVEVQSQKQQEKHAGLQIRGHMSLNELEDLTGVRRERLLRELGLSPGLPGETRLSTLRHEHAITLREIRRAIRGLSDP